MAVPEWVKQLGMGAYAGFDDFLFNVPDFLWSKFDKKSFDRMKKERQEGKYRIAENVGDMSSILGDILLIPLAGAGAGKIAGKLGVKGGLHGAKAGLKIAKALDKASDGARAIDKVGDFYKGASKALKNADGFAKIALNAGKGGALSFGENVLRSNIARTEEERDAYKASRKMALAFGLGGGAIGGAISSFAKKTPKEALEAGQKATKEAKIANLGREFKNEYKKVNNRFRGAKTAEQVDDELAELGGLVEDLKKNNKTIQDFKKELSKEYKEIYKNVSEVPKIKNAVIKLEKEFNLVESLFDADGGLKKGITPKIAKQKITQTFGETTANVLLESNIEDRVKLLKGFSTVKNNLQLGEKKIMTLGRDIQKAITSKDLSSKADGLASDLYAKSESLLANFDQWKALNKKYKLASIIEAGELQEAMTAKPKFMEQIRNVLAGQEFGKALAGAGFGYFSGDNDDTVGERALKVALGGVGGVALGRAIGKGFDDLSRLGVNLNTSLLNSNLAKKVANKKVYNQLARGVGDSLSSVGGDYISKVEAKKQIAELLESEKETEKAKENANYLALRNSVQSFIERELLLTQDGELSSEAIKRIETYRDNLLANMKKDPSIVPEYIAGGNKDAVKLLQAKNILTNLDWSNKDDQLQIKYAFKKIGVNEKDASKYIRELRELGKRNREKRIKEIIAQSANKNLTPFLISMFESGGM